MASSFETEFILLANPILFQNQKYIGISRTVVSSAFKDTREVSGFRYLFINWHKNVYNYVGRLRFLSSVDHSVVQQLSFAWIPTIQFQLLVVYRTCFTREPHRFVTGPANSFGFKSCDKQWAARASENTWFMCSSDTVLGDTGKRNIRKQKNSRDTPVIVVIISVRNTGNTMEMVTFVFLYPSEVVSTIPNSIWLEQIPMTDSKSIR